MCQDAIQVKIILFFLGFLLKLFFFVQCWKSRTRDIYGTERVSRGCTTSHDHLPLLCNQNNNVNGGDGPRKRHTGQFIIDCCTGDYCNNGSFPELVPVIADGVTSKVNGAASPSMFYLKLTSAIIGPFLVLSCLALFVIYFIRRTHYKRATRSKQDPETYYASEDFRATSAGDSTLRVRFFFSRLILLIY